MKHRNVEIMFNVYAGLSQRALREEKGQEKRQEH